MFLCKLYNNSNGQRWYNLYRNISLNRNYRIKKLKVKKLNNKKILVRHRQSPSNCYYFKYSNNTFFFKYLIVSNFYNFYKNRVPLMELVDYWGNYYYLRSISGLSFGSRIKVLPSLLHFDKKDLIGSRFFLKFLNFRYPICNLILQNKKTMATSRGVCAKIIKNENILNLCLISLPSGKKKVINNNSFCSIGKISGIRSYTEIYGKAGIRRNLGFRPTVRGVAMNPVDHPHGGRTKTNSPEKSPWGWITKLNK